MKKRRLSELNGFEEFDKYEIREDGIVISYNKNRITEIKGYNKNGYLCVDLHYKKKRGVKIHRLVALAFVDNSENKPQVNHINGNKQDNRIENIEWVTNSENQKHANSIGLRNYKYNHNKEFQHIFQYSLNGDLIAEHISIGNACIAICGEYNKTKVSNIYKCCTNKCNEAYGYKWSFN